MGLGYEDFTGWVENDGDLSQTVTRSTWTTMQRLAVAHLSKDSGASYWADDFTVQFTVRVTDIDEVAAQQNVAAIIAFSDTIEPWNGGGDKIGVQLYSANDPGFYQLRVIEREGGANVVYGAKTAKLNDGQDYYCVFVRNHPSVALYVYSDPNHTDLVTSSSLTATNDEDYRYVMCPTSINAANATESSGYVEYLAEAESASVVPPLPAQFQVGQGARSLAATFFTNISEASVEIPAEFHVGQNARDVPAQFQVGQDFSDVLSEFVVRQSSSLDLPSELTVRHSASLEFLAQFAVTHWERIPSEFIVRHSDALEMPTEFVVRHSAALEIPAEFHAGQDSAALPAEAIIRHSDSEEIPTEFIVRQTRTKDLLMGFRVVHPPGLLAIFYVRPHDLLATELIIGGIEGRRMKIR